MVNYDSIVKGTDFIISCERTFVVDYRAISMENVFESIILELML